MTIITNIVDSAKSYDDSALDSTIVPQSEGITKIVGNGVYPVEVSQNIDEIFSNGEMHDVVMMLIKLGLPALPVAPWFSKEQYPKCKKENGQYVPIVGKDGKPVLERFTSKNPSRLDKQGKPISLNHEKFNDGLPTANELEKFFVNPKTGIGTKGSKYITFVDFDFKNFPDGSFNERIAQWEEQYPIVKETWDFNTQGKGRRKVFQVLDCDCQFFSLDGKDGAKHGELLAYGDFTVLPPTMGVSGNRYANNKLVEPIVIESLESIGIYPLYKTEKKKSTKQRKEKQACNVSDFDSVSGLEQPQFDVSISLMPLISKNSLRVLAGEMFDNPSLEFVKTAQDLAGWVNLAAEKNIGIVENLDQLLVDAAIALDRLEKIDRMLIGVDLAGAMPSLHYSAGEAGCLKRIKANFPEEYNTVFPCSSDLNFVTKKGFDKTTSVLQLLSDSSLATLSGNPSQDVQASCRSLIQDILGGQNWLNNLGYGITEEIEELVKQCIDNNKGLDVAACFHKLRSIDPINCLPAIFWSFHKRTKNGDLGCFDKIKKHDIELFNELASDEIKATLIKSDNNKYVTVVEGITVESSQPFNIQKFEQFYKPTLKFTPDIVIHEEKFKIPDGLPKDDVIYLIKSGLGTDKTGAAIRLIRQIQDELNKGSHFIVPRNKLAEQIIGRGQKEGVEFLPLNQPENCDRLADDNASFVYCPESAPKAEGYYKGKDIYLDEFDTICNQINGGQTLTPFEVAKVTDILDTAFNSANVVALFDANNSDRHYNLLRRICPNRKIIRIENTFSWGALNFNIVDGYDTDKEGNKEYKVSDYSFLTKKLLDPNITPFVACESKKEGESLFRQAVKAGKKGFIINQESSEETNLQYAQRFAEVETGHESTGRPEEKFLAPILRDPDKIIDQYKPGFVIASPTVECGFSMMSERFDVGLLIHKGILGVNGMLQMSRRARLVKEFYAHCPVRALLPRKNQETGKTHFTVGYFDSLWKEYVNEFPSLTEEDQQKAKQEMITKVIQRINSPWADFHAESLAIHAYEQENLRFCYMYRLKQQGHNVTVIEVERDKVVYKETKHHVEEQGIEIAEDIYNAIPFENTAECHKAKTNNPCKETDVRIAKFILLEKLPGLTTKPCYDKELVRRLCVNNRGHFLQEIENRFLIHNPEINDKVIDKNDFDKLCSEFATTKSVDKTSDFKIMECRKMGIAEILKKLDNGEVFSKNTPWVEQLYKHCRKSRSHFVKEFFPTKPETVEKTERIDLVKEILGRFGYVVKCDGKRRLDENKIKTQFHFAETRYVLGSAIPQLMECLDERYSIFVNTKYQKPDYNEAQAVGGLPERFKHGANKEIVGDVKYAPPMKQTFSLPEMPKEFSKLGLTLEDIKDVSVLQIAKQIIKWDNTSTNKIASQKAATLLEALEDIEARNFVKLIDSVLVDQWETMLKQPSLELIY